MYNNHPGIRSFYSFIDAFNTVDKNQIIQNLHFPHVTHSNGNEPVIYKNGDIFWKSLQIQFDHMIKFDQFIFDDCNISFFVLRHAPRLQFMRTLGTCTVPK